MKAWGKEDDKPAFLQVIYQEDKGMGVLYGEQLSHRRG